MSEERIDEEGPGFEAVIAELQALVQRLEAGELGLEETLALYERGVALARRGNRLLQGAERRVEVLQAELDAELAPGGERGRFT